MEYLHLHFSQRREKFKHFYFDKAKKNKGKDKGSSKKKKDKKVNKNAFFFPVSGLSSDKWNPTPGQRYGSKRTGHNHQGVDIGVAEGTALRAVTGGTVVKAYTSNRAGGLTVQLRTDRGDFVYMHLSGFAKGIKNGTQVSAGQIIGYAGGTGAGGKKTFSSHLHFEYWPKGWKPNKKGIGSVNPTQMLHEMGGIGKAEDLETQALRYLGTNDPRVLAEEVLGYQQIGARLGTEISKEEAYIGILNGYSPEQLAKTLYREDETAKELRRQASTSAISNRHGFEAGITEAYRELLGVAPSKSTIAMHMGRYDSTGGMEYDINDVQEFIRNSKQFKEKLERRSIPEILGTYDSLLGIKDIRQVAPATFNYVLNKFKSGEWKDATDVQGFIAQSPQYRKRQGELLKEETKKTLAEKYGLDPTSDFLNQITLKQQSGSTFDQIENMIRGTAEFKKRYVGIQDNEDPTEYDNKVSQLNRIWLQYRGRSFDTNNPDDYAYLKQVRM